MVQKYVINPHRVRKLTGSFAYIEHRFLRDGFFSSLSHAELLLYIFLVMVSDQEGLSWYSYNKICSLLDISVDTYVEARDALIDKNLISFDGHLFQVLSLPEAPCVKNCNDNRSAISKPVSVKEILSGLSGGKNARS